MTEAKAKAKAKEIMNDASVVPTALRWAIILNDYPGINSGATKSDVRTGLSRVFRNGKLLH